MQRPKRREKKRTHVCCPSVPPSYEAPLGRTPFPSSGGADRMIPALAGERWEQMAAAAVSSTRSPGGRRGSGSVFIKLMNVWSGAGAR